MTPGIDIANATPRGWRAWLRPAPDSPLADAMRRGKSPKSEFIHLLWSAWVFVTPLLGSHYSWRWAAVTITTSCSTGKAPRTSR